jgi:hypothetical protein
MLRLLAATLLLVPVAGAQSPMERISSAFAGRWTIVDSSERSSHGAKQPPRNGEEYWHTLVGGAPLIEEYRSQAVDGTWEYDTAAIWWDAAAHRYRGIYCADFLDHGCDNFDIQLQAKTNGPVVMSGSYTQKTKSHRWREVFEFPTPTNFTQRLYVGEEGSKLKLVATIQATRISK